MHEVHRMFTRFSQDIMIGLKNKALYELNLRRLQDGQVLEIGLNNRQNSNMVAHIISELEDEIERETMEFEEKMQQRMMKVIEEAYHREKDAPIIHERLDGALIPNSYQIVYGKKDNELWVKRLPRFGETFRESPEFPIKSIAIFSRSMGQVEVAFDEDGKERHIYGSVSDYLLNEIDYHIEKGRFQKMER